MLKAIIRIFIEFAAFGLLILIDKETREDFFRKSRFRENLERELNESKKGDDQ